MSDYEDENFIHEFDVGRVQLRKNKDFCIESDCKVEWNDIRSVFKMEGNETRMIWMMREGRIKEERVQNMLKRKFPQVYLSC